MIYHNKFWRPLFWVILVFLAYHALRDTLQIAGVENVLTTLFHRPHAWCSSTCDYVAFPIEIAGIISASIVLNRDHIGLLGIGVLFIPVLLLFGTLLP